MNSESVGFRLFQWEMCAITQYRNVLPKQVDTLEQQLATIRNYWLALTDCERMDFERRGQRILHTLRRKY